MTLTAAPAPIIAIAAVETAAATLAAVGEVFCFARVKSQANVSTE